MRRLVLMAVLALSATASAAEKPRTAAPPAGGRTAAATLLTPAGVEVGRARVTEVAGGLHVAVEVKGAPAGMHGAHLHTIGRCDPPDFASAGGHWNPTNMKHGSKNPQGPHAGDMPNLTVGADGRGTLGIDLAGASFDSLMDADGATVVLHAAADDLMTDPSGNSGGRIACGVLKLG